LIPIYFCCQTALIIVKLLLIKFGYYFFFQNNKNVTQHKHLHDFILQTSKLMIK